MGDLKGSNPIKISVLVAARNEEVHLPACLGALAAQDLPEGSWEVWVGNDRSTDKTEEIAESFSKKHAHFHCVHITENVAQLKAKANVLAQLARKAKGEYLLITDADTLVPKTWAREMVEIAEKKQVATLTGITLLRGGGLLGQWQSLEWMQMLHLAEGMAALGLPFTAMGNNCLVKKSAYETIGGYESIPFSVTEDFALYNALRHKGYDFWQTTTPKVQAWSWPMESFASLLRQRKRWLRGAWGGHWSVRLLGALFSLQLFLWFLFFFLSPSLASSFWLAKYCLQLVLQLVLLRKFRLKPPWGAMFTHEFYVLFFYPVLFFSFLFSPKIRWKGEVL